MPEPEDYGFVNSVSFDGEPGGWTLEGGEDAYYKALKIWEEYF